MNKWYVVCSILAVIIGTQSILYFDLYNKHMSVSANYEDLSLLHSELTANFTSLDIEYSMLLLNYSDLENEYNYILQEHNSLQTEYTDLETTFQELQTIHANLEESYTYLQTEFNSLKINYASLSEDYDTLQNQYDTLESLYATLEDEYNRYVSAYQELRDRINQRFGWEDLESFITPEDSSVSNMTYSITGGWSDPSDFNEAWDDMKAMYMWVRDNIDYRYDGLYPVLPFDPAGSVDHYTEMWQFPNETLNLLKGDCEDQAILLCSMIRCYNNMEYKTECIGITSFTSGHLAVQIPVSGYELVIFDSAGNYYSHDIWGNIVFNDVTSEINNWLDYWKPTMGNDVYVDLVFSDYIDKTFISTDEYIAWMYSR